MAKRTGVAIIGAGFSGIGMAIALKKAGFEDFTILEKADRVGGTWRENTYPGCACDIRSHLYSFSFEPKHDWSREFAPQEEILGYLEHCVEKYGLRRHIRFGMEVTGLEYEDEASVWRVMFADGETEVARCVFAGLGPLHIPHYPEISGLERFGGRAFHSADWDHSYDLTGKRVAVIGTGASAIQFVPQIAGQAAQVTVFQRTPPWVIPKPDRKFSRREHRLFARVPGMQRAYRSAIYWQQEALGIGFRHPRLNKMAERIGRWHIASKVNDRELRRKLTPDYTLGCKRVLVSNDYYPTLNRPDVEVVTDGIKEISESAVVADKAYDADAIIFGTGFHVTDAKEGAHIVGRNGVKIQDAWRDGVEAHLGTMVAGFPNLFLAMGPNSGLGHNSMIFILESQIRYVMQCLRLLSNRRARGIEVRADAQRTFNEWVQERSAGSVWLAGGCKSWYLDENGVNRAAWPASTIKYWRQMRRLRIADYDITR